MLLILISDIHANYSALKSVEQAVEWLHLNPKDYRYWFLGDLVGYGPASEAAECISWLRFSSRIFNRNGNHRGWVPGNHDEWIKRQSGRLHDDARVTLKAHRRHLQQYDPDNWNWFTNYVENAITDEQHTLKTECFQNSPAGSLTLFFTHGSIRPLLRRDDYLYPWQRTKVAGELLSLSSDHLYPWREEKVSRSLQTLQTETDSPTACLVTGHTHFPVLGKLSDSGRPVYISIRYGQPISLSPGQWLINPGSVGQPRDGDPRAAFAILDTNAHTITFRRVEYDIQAVINKLNAESNDDVREKNAYQSLVERLKTGGALKNEHLMKYHDKVYHLPACPDLEAIPDE